MNFALSENSTTKCQYLPIYIYFFITYVPATHHAGNAMSSIYDLKDVNFVDPNTDRHAFSNSASPQY